MSAIKKRRTLILVIVLSLAFLSAAVFLFTLSSDHNGADPLSSVYDEIAVSYPSVQQLTLEQFEQISDSEILVFDVRETDEYTVSHLPSAISLSPDIEAEEFLEDFGEQIQGKQLVFYCSVGKRSSEMIKRLTSSENPIQGGPNPKSMYNLKGGVFAWVNSERQLVQRDGQKTDAIHPYNAYWGRLIKDAAKRHY